MQNVFTLMTDFHMNIFTTSYFTLKVIVNYLVIRHLVIIDQVFPRVEL